MLDEIDVKGQSDDVFNNRKEQLDTDELLCCKNYHSRDTIRQEVMSLRNATIKSSKMKGKVFHHNRSLFFTICRHQRCCPREDY